MASTKKWIAGATKKKGKLHEALHVPKDEKIPAAKLHAAAKKGGKIGKEARLAETLKGKQTAASKAKSKQIVIEVRAKSKNEVV